MEEFQSHNITFNAMNPEPPLKRSRSTSNLDQVWYAILFAHLVHGHSEVIRTFLGASMLSYYSLLELLMGSEGIRCTLPNIFNLDAPGMKSFKSAHATMKRLYRACFILPAMLREETVVLDRKLRIAYERKTFLELRSGILSEYASPTGIHPYSAYSNVLSFRHPFTEGCFYVDCNFLGLIDFSDCYHIMAGAFGPISPVFYASDAHYLFDDHLQSIVKECFSSAQVVHDICNHYELKTCSIESGQIKISLPRDIGGIAFKFNPAEGIHSMEPTMGMNDSLIQGVMCIISSFHRSPVRHKPSQRYVENSLPFIASILRTTLVRSSVISFARLAPSTPWTIAISYFITLPTPSGLFPLVDAFYAFHGRSNLKLVWNPNHLDDLCQILEYWVATLHHYDDIAVQLGQNPLYNHYSYFVFNAVCSVIFVNLLRSLVVGIVEPFICKEFLSDSMLQNVRRRFRIYDFDESIPSIQGDDMWIHQLMGDTHTENPFITLCCSKHHDLCIRLSRVFNTLTAMCEENRCRNRPLPSQFTFEFPTNLHFSEPTDLVVDPDVFSTSFQDYLVSIFKQNIVLNHINYNDTSTFNLIYGGLGLYINGNRAVCNRNKVFWEPEEDDHFGILWDSMSFFIAAALHPSLEHN